ncbi:Protein KRTCAP2 [Dirofilaria immitis]
MYHTRLDGKSFNQCFGLFSYCHYSYCNWPNYEMASKLGTLIAGALCSLVFVFLLTAASNFQMSSIGEQAKTGLTEALLCLVIAVIVSATIHRVAITVCLLLSIFLLFLLTGISQTRYTTTVVQQVTQQRKKK